MYAAVVHANLPGGVNDERLAMLKDEVIPQIKAAPGFVAGYWLDAVKDDALAVVLFNDEASAKAAAPPAGAEMGNGVTIKSVDFVEVVGHA